MTARAVCAPLRDIRAPVALSVRPAGAYLQDSRKGIAMLRQIRGLHHITARASGPRANDAFYTARLGLRRVKKTVNFDAPDLYHLYFGTACGAPGTVYTTFPRPGAARGRRGTGEVGQTAFAIPPGSAAAWELRLADLCRMTADRRFGQDRVLIEGPDGESLALVETPDDPRPHWPGGGVPAGMAIRGLAGATLCLRDIGPTADLLRLMGYAETATEGAVTRLSLPGGGPARHVDLVASDLPPAREGAGSVHHIAFAVDNRARQLEVAEALQDAGHEVTPPRDRTYFHAIYFRSPGGVLFEVATAAPGFTRDEPEESLGTCLKLPGQHEHLRGRLERSLESLG